MLAPRPLIAGETADAGVTRLRGSHKEKIEGFQAGSYRSEEKSLEIADFVWCSGEDYLVQCGGRRPNPLDARVDAGYWTGPVKRSLVASPSMSQASTSNSKTKYL